MEFTLGRDAFQRFSDNEFDIAADKCDGVHRAHIDASIPAVAVIHDMTYAIRNFRGSVGHSWRHKAGIVSLDLIIDVIGMRIVLPVTRLGRIDAA